MSSVLRHRAVAAALLVALVAVPSASLAAFGVHAPSAGFLPHAPPLSGSARVPLGSPPAVSAVGPVSALRPVPASFSTGGTIRMTDGAILPGIAVTQNVAVPLGLAYDSSNASVLVSGAYSGTVGRFDAGSGASYAWGSVNSVPTYPTVFGGAATALAYDSGNDTVFVAEPGRGGVGAVSASDITPWAFIPLGPTSVPSALAYDPVRELVFVADQRLDRVDVISAVNYSVLGQVGVGAQPDALWVDQGSHALFVANAASANLSVLDLSTLNVSSPVVNRTLSVGLDPVAIAQVGGSVWVLNRGSGNISLVDDASWTVAGSISLPSGSAGSATSLVYDTGRGVAYVLNAPAGDLAIVNASTQLVSGSAAVGGTPYRGVYDPVHGTIVLVDSGWGTLEILNDGSNALVVSERLGSAPMASFFDASTELVYVADAAVSELEELDARTNALVGTIPLAAPGLNLTFSSQANLLAVVLANGQVAFVNPGSSAVQGTWGTTNGSLLLHGAYGNGEFIFTGGQPYSPTPFNDVFLLAASGLTQLNCVGAGTYDNAVSYDSTNRNVYVATGSSILVVSTVSNDKVAQIPLPAGSKGVGIAFASAANAVLVSDWGYGDLYLYNISLSAFDTPALTALIDPSSVTYLAATNSFYVAVAGTDELVSVVDHGGGSYSTASTTVGYGPTSATYSTLSGLLYVGNARDGTISLLQIGSTAQLPMVVFLSVSPAAVAFGGSVRLQATATYPMWSDSFSYSGLPSGCPSQNLSSFSCTPSLTGTFSVTVVATNPFGASASATEPLAVFTPLTVVAFTASPSEFTLGLTTRLVLTTSGGIAPLTVGYPVRPPGCGATTSTNWTCTPSQAGNFTVEATITDGGGHSASQNVSLVVNPHLTIVSFLPSSNTTSTGTPVVFTVNLSGGTAPFTFSYTGLPAGCASANSSSLTCTPSASGVFPVLVRVTDRVGVSTTATATLVVSGGSTTSATGGLTTTELVVLLVVVVAVVAVVVVALLRRGRAPPAPSGPAPASPTPPPAEEEAEAEPAEEAAPEAYVVAAPPPEPILPPTPPPAAPRAAEPEPTPPPPRYFSEPGTPAAPPPAPAAAPGAGRPPLVCRNCGTSNEPWLTVCRKCKRALLSTGSR